jgi:hypothetical protein
VSLLGSLGNSDIFSLNTLRSHLSKYLPYIHTLPPPISANRKHRIILRPSPCSKWPP